MTTPALRARLLSALRFLTLSVIAVCVLYPLLWVFLSSVKTEDELFLNPWGLPSTFSLEPYKRVIAEYGLQWNILNSVWITAASTALVVLLSAMAAYGMIRMKWRGSRWALAYILLGIMVPGHATLIPIYLNLQSLRDVVDERLILLIPYVAGGLSQAILILSGYFLSLSREIEEAGVMDGSSLIGIFFRIIIPISMPAIATVTIFSFIFTWNELLYGLVFLQKTSEQTIPVAILRFVGFYSTDWSKVLASVSMTMIPSIVLYMLGQDKIVQGITDGAIKS
jgi:raffinose/stachyose/melibiose transport system permease protein